VILEAGLIVSRFLHYAAVLILFGVAFLPLYAYPSRAALSLARPGCWFHPTLFGAALVAFLSGIFWLASTTANMTGALSGATDLDALSSVVRDSDFGQVWIVRLGLAIALLGWAGVRFAPSADDHPDIFAPLLAGLLLASLGWVGHTQHEEGLGRLIHESADGAHLLAAGAWLGGLLGLSFILIPSRGDRSPDQGLEDVLLRFSGMGYVAVAVLVASGLTNSWFLVGSVRNLFATYYGQLLLLKLSLFAGMLALAAANRFWLVPRLLLKKGERSVLQQLRRNVLGEQLLGTFVILVVSVLGIVEPAVGQMP